MNQQEFINTIGEKIKIENAKRGNPLFSSVVLAQAILESGWGKSSLMMKANAIFGIKANTNWNGKMYNAKTWEVVDGNVYNIVDCFRAYNSLEESISDYFDLITKSDRYKKALNRQSPLECITEIKNGGYATDPQYINKVLSLINTWNLTRFDENYKSPYEIGKNYKLKENLFVRCGAGKNYSIKAYNELTDDGKKHALVQKDGENAVLKSGTVVTCLDVIQNGNDIWLKIPSGYVAGLYKGEILIDVNR